MYRMMLIYGILAGTVIIGSMLLHISHGVDPDTGMWIGYLIMLVALSLIFVGIKRYRDTELGGVIRFSTAFGVGIGIALVASVIYVVGWEIYLAATDYAFFDQYSRALIEAKRADGATAAELARMSAEMAELGETYNNQPLFRIGFTFIEILPVGLVVTLVSAALLRNSRFLPARGGSAGA